MRGASILLGFFERAMCAGAGAGAVGFSFHLSGRIIIVTGQDEPNSITPANEWDTFR
jgi:hypothetical protein